MTLRSLLLKKDITPVADPLEQVQKLLADVQSERRSLETTLSSPEAAGLQAVRAALDAFERRADTLTIALDQLGSRVEQIARVAGTVDRVEPRVAALEEVLRGADARVGQVLEQAAAWEDQRWALHEMNRLAQATLTRLEALVSDDQVVRLAREMPAMKDECLRIREQYSALAGETALLRERSETGRQEAAVAAELSREASQRAEAATGCVEAIERRLQPLAEASVLAQDTATQLQALNALAEHVGIKLKAIEAQHQTVERALVESRRVGEMVWEMEVQIGRLNEGSALASRVEEDLARLERLHQELTARLDDAGAERARWTEQTERQQREGLELQQAVQEHLDRLAVRRKEIDTLAERLRAAHAGVADAERRLTGVSANERTLAVMGEKMGTLSDQVQEMTLQVQTLAEKQAALAVLEDRLAAADRGARDVAAQMEDLAERRRDLERLKQAFDAVEGMHAGARRLVDDLRNEKLELARFVHQAERFMAGAPEVHAAIADIGSRVAKTEAQAARAIAMEPQLEDLSGRLAALAPRLRLAETVHERLAALHELSAENDARLQAQLARQAELEQLRVACNGLAAQAADAQHRLDAVEAAQTRLRALVDQVALLDADISTARQQLSALQRDEEAIAAQDRHLSVLQDSARALAIEVAGRLESVQGVHAELARVEARREEVSEILSRLQSVQRDVAGTSRQTSEHLEELRTLARELDDRRAGLAAIEPAIAAVEARFRSLDDLTATVHGKVEALAERERVVEAVREELEVIHAISRESREDLAALTERRAEIADARGDLARVSTALADVDGKIAEVERRGAAVEETRRKADAAVRLLEDARITLETIGEQKAMVDHVAEMFVRLDQVISDAKGTAQVLQSERKLAQRIADNVRNIHSRAGADIRHVG